MSNSNGKTKPSAQRRAVKRAHLQTKQKVKFAAGKKSQVLGFPKSTKKRREVGKKNAAKLATKKK